MRPLFAQDRAAVSAGLFLDGLLSDERAAYHRGAHWRERVAMAEWWSNHIDTLRDGAEIISLAGKVG